MSYLVMVNTMARILVSKAPDECSLCDTDTVNHEAGSWRFQRKGLIFSASGLTCKKCGFTVYIMPEHIKNQLSKIRGAR